jgi:4-diphosphocytidyl-2-C-methyl-D-erythritol kinase
MISRKSYAKINLFLQVLGKRIDGFHNLNTLFTRINIYDEISVDFSDKFSIETSSNNIPSGKDNIIFKVKNILENKFDFNCSVKVFLKKNIPVGGGLGGGSSNAAVFLSIIDELFGLNLSMEAKSNILASVGSDTVFFLYDKPMIGTSRGEILIPAPDIPELSLLIVNPNIFISTKEIFQDKNLRLTPKKEVIRMRQPLELPDLCKLMRNDLEKPVFSKYRNIRDIKENLEDSGALKALMSGSGSTVFGVFESYKDAIKVGEKFKKKYPEYFIRTAITL